MAGGQWSVEIGETVEIGLPRLPAVFSQSVVAVLARVGKRQTLVLAGGSLRMSSLTWIEVGVILVLKRHSR